MLNKQLLLFVKYVCWLLVMFINYKTVFPKIYFYKLFITLLKSLASSCHNLTQHVNSRRKKEGARISWMAIFLLTVNGKHCLVLFYNFI